MATSPVSPGLANVVAAVSAMYGIDRRMTASAISRMREDMPRPTAAPLGITDLARRQELFRKFVAICREYELGLPNTTALCLFVLLPLDRVERHVNIASDVSYAAAMYRYFCTTAYTGLRIFLTKLSPTAMVGAPRSSADATTPGALSVGHQANVLASSPLTQLPMTNVSPSPEPARATRKRKAPPENWDGPSMRTRLRTRSAASVSQPLPPPPPSAATPLPVAAAPPALTTPPRPAPGPIASPSTPPSLVAANAPGSPFAPPSPTPSFIQRSRAATEAARARDNNRCILTDHPVVQAAHIYPFSATKLAYHDASGASIQASTAHAAMGTLISLWGENLKDTWRNACNDKAVSETARNLLCMDHHMHALWGRAYFGLEPLVQRDATAPDGTGAEIDFCFHWLYRGTRRPRDPVDDADDATLATVCGRPDDPPLAPLAHRRSGVPLETGHVFTIRANSASDLPSFALLEIQWHLTRLAAMSGAADIDDDDDDNENDNDMERVVGAGQGTWARQDAILENWLYDTDVEPFDLDTAEPADRTTERRGP